MQDNSHFIKAENVSVNYGAIMAVDDISFSIEKGSSFALLGQNGAGKSTLMKSLLGLIPIKNGVLSINGVNASEALARKSVAYLPEKFQFYEFYKVIDVLRFYGEMNKLSKSEIEEQIQLNAKTVGLEKLLNKKVTQLSKGQLQRTGLATLLMGDYEIFFLDEPFSGLDPIAIKEMKQVLKDLNQKDKTLMINSHILSEVEQLCTDMMIINDGKKIIHGNIAKLRKEKTLEDFFYDSITRSKSSGEE